MSGQFWSGWFAAAAKRTRRNLNTGEVDTWLINNGHLVGGSVTSIGSTAWQPPVIQYRIGHDAD
jgi:hypothetical protein